MTMDYASRDDSEDEDRPAPEARIVPATEARITGPAMAEAVAAPAVAADGSGATADAARAEDAGGGRRRRRRRRRGGRREENGDGLFQAGREWCRRW